MVYQSPIAGHDASAVWMLTWKMVWYLEMRWAGNTPESYIPHQSTRQPPKKNKHEGNWLYLQLGSFSHHIRFSSFHRFLLVLVSWWKCECQISIFCFELYHPDSWQSVWWYLLLAAQLQEASVFLGGWLDLQRDEGRGNFLLDRCHQSHSWVKYGFDLAPNFTMKI